jgi:hypothetical protein
VSRRDRLGLTPNLTTRALWPSTETPLEQQKMGEGNENLVYVSPWDFKSYLTCRKILRHGTFRLYLPAEIKVCCGILSPLKMYRQEPGTSGSIVSDYGLDDRTIGVRSPAGAKDFSSSLCIQTGSGAHPASCQMGTGGSFPGGKSAAGA